MPHLLSDTNMKLRIGMISVVIAVVLVTFLATSLWIADRPLRNTLRNMSRNLDQSLQTPETEVIDSGLITKIFKKQNKLSGQNKNVINDMSDLGHKHDKLVDQQEQLFKKVEAIETKTTSNEKATNQQSFFNSNPDLADFICRNQDCFKAAFERCKNSEVELQEHKSKIKGYLTTFGQCSVATQCWQTTLATVLSNCKTIEEFKFELLLHWVIFMEASDTLSNKGSTIKASSGDASGRSQT